jgi:hypothetical protein
MHTCMRISLIEIRKFLQLKPNVIQQRGVIFRFSFKWKINLILRKLWIDRDATTRKNTRKENIDFRAKALRREISRDEAGALDQWQPCKGRMKDM